MLRLTARSVRASRFRPTVGAVATLMLLAAWWVVLRPQSLGGPAAYVIVSGESMEPTLRGGDLVAVWRRPSYGAGEIVAYRIPEGDPGAGAVVIHRVIDGSATVGYRLRGDNTQGPDLWRPRSPDVIGRVWVRVPGAGRVLAPLLSPLWLGLVAGVSAALSVLLSGFPAPGVRPGSSGVGRHRADHRRGLPPVGVGELSRETATPLTAPRLRGG
jgi:signal peptidase I